MIVVRKPCLSEPHPTGPFAELANGGSGRSFDAEFLDLTRRTICRYDLTPLAESVGALLKERGEKIAVADSSAGGLISAALLAVPGASAYYLGGIVSYTGCLGWRCWASRRRTWRAPGCGRARSRTRRSSRSTLREKMGATWALAETGASGPTGNRYGDDAGHACFAVSGPVERAVTLETGSADREANMWAFARRALELLEECVRAA